MPEDIPKEDEIKNFWESIWSNEVTHRQAEWLNDIAYNGEVMQYEQITIRDIQQATSKTHNWKAPGPDQIQNYWWKKYTSVYPYLAKQFTKIIQEPNQTPSFMTEGKTYLIPKDLKNTKNPGKYRPITCLPTIYKILTSCLTEKIYQHVYEKNIIAEHQKGCRREAMGCKEQLIIDEVILEQAKKQNRNIHIAYIDYQKAFDSVPHSWLIHILSTYKIHPCIVNFLENIMQKWKTTLILTSNTKSIYIKDIEIRRGIFQGDALSALWFTIAINPLSTLLNSTHYGFKIKEKINVTNYILSHNLYMDDLKIYAGNESHLKQMINITQKFSEDIRMKFGLDKCRTIHIIKGKMTNRDENTIISIESMKLEEKYKYLGIEQASTIDHTNIKKNVTKQFQERLNYILKTELNGKNTTKAINTFAIPVLTYTFGVIKWSETDLDHLQRMIRTTLTKYGAHHTYASAERMTLPRKEGGRGIIDIKNMYYKQILTLRNYFYQRNDSRLHNAIVKADMRYTPINLTDKNMNIHIETINEVKDKWAARPIYGRHYRDITDQSVDKLASNNWLHRGDLFRETEAYMIAIQDNVLPTRNYQRYVIKTPNVKDECRKCGEKGETVEHIISGCKTMAGEEYTKRHNSIAKVIHQELAHKCKLIQDRIPTFKYLPDPVLESADFKLIWDRSVITDKQITANRPDIILIDRKKCHTYLIDVAIPNTRNLVKKYNEKVTKYQELSEEIKRMWKQQKVEIIPLIISATGIVPQNLFRSLNSLALPRSTYAEMQKQAILGTCHITRKFMA